MAWHSTIFKHSTIKIITSRRSKISSKGFVFRNFYNRIHLKSSEFGPTIASSSSKVSHWKWKVNYFYKKTSKFIWWKCIKAKQYRTARNKTWLEFLKRTNEKIGWLGWLHKKSN